MPTIDYQLLDVFADTDAEGNPAAVVPAADGLTDAQMQAAATALGVSDTAFVLRERGPRLRWFTPACEIELCGHATLAAAAAIGVARRESFGYAGGRLEVSVEAIGGEPLWWLDRPAPTCAAAALALDAVLEALGRPALGELPPESTSDGDLLIFLAEAAEVEGLAPDFGALGAALSAEGWRGLAAIGPGEGRYDLRTRFFAPHLGIPEDPVTGSVHGAIAVSAYQNELLACFPEELRALSRQGAPGGRQGTVWLRLRCQDGVPRSVATGGRIVAVGGGRLTV